MTSEQQSGRRLVALVPFADLFNEDGTVNRAMSERLYEKALATIDAERRASSRSETGDSK